MTEGTGVPPPASSSTTPAVLGIRKSVDSLTSDEAAALRTGITKMLAISDDRGYEFMAGIHGLPLPMYCKHDSPLFLPWHRAYLYTFEQYLLDQEPAVRLPWWDWADDQAIPDAYGQLLLPDGSANPLAAAPITGIPDNQFTEESVPQVSETYRQPATGPDAYLPTPDMVTTALGLDDFSDFTTYLEQQIHNPVHDWVGGTMAMIPLAAFDPIFWAHHTMIDRIWSFWQQTHPGAGVGTVRLSQPLAPFHALNVGDVLSISGLGYTYAVFSSSAVV
jgi:tyrosinase